MLKNKSRFSIDPEILKKDKLLDTFSDQTENGVHFSPFQPQTADKQSMGISNFILSKEANNNSYKVMHAHSAKPSFIMIHMFQTFSALYRESQERLNLQFMLLKFRLLLKVSQNTKKIQKLRMTHQHQTIFQSLSLWLKNTACSTSSLNSDSYIFTN